MLYIRFQNVSFSYNKKEPNISNINFALQKGETLGIIGATGAGKSTVAQLLMRFYDPDEGAISIEGQDIRSIPTGELREKFGVVFQNDHARTEKTDAADDLCAHTDRVTGAGGLVNKLVRYHDQAGTYAHQHMGAQTGCPVFKATLQANQTAT